MNIKNKEKMNHAILLDKRPVGRPELSDFNLVTEEKPEIQLEVLLRTSYVSVDPYLRVE
jgi:NADPH-dependent curcumin reductase CurA